MPAVRCAGPTGCWCGRQATAGIGFHDCANMRIRRGLRARLSLFVWPWVLFLVLYPTLNAFTDFRQTYRLDLRCDSAIPMVPWMVYFYLSIFPALGVAAVVLNLRVLRELSGNCSIAILMASAVFLIFPTTLNYAGDVGVDNMALGLVRKVDGPNNCFPSLHVAIGLLLTTSYLRSERFVFQVASVLWCPLLIASVLLTHRHHTLDVLGGAVLAFVAYVTPASITDRIVRPACIAWNRPRTAKPSHV